MANTSSLTDYNVTIRNCNSIGETTITLRPASLNIKYGPNGIGKSTIARALTLRTEGKDALNELTPFKHKATTDGPRPTVDGADDIAELLFDAINDLVDELVARPAATRSVWDKLPAGVRATIERKRSAQRPA